MPKTKVAVLFGGRSGEHEVSRNSAFSVAQALKGSYEVLPIGIAKDGQWYGPVKIDEIPVFTPETYQNKAVTILPNPQSGGTIYTLPDLEPITRVQVFFPVLHGTFGEDGTLQGLLEMAEVPYVGGGVLASALGMDKLLMKAVFAQAGLPQVQYLGFLRKEIMEKGGEVADRIEKTLGYPCFVKPANLGSSVGISKVKNRNELYDALDLAAQYDRKVIVEQGVDAREIEISVLGNDTPVVSVPGEIVPCNEFYDYNAKYVDDRSELIIPARLDEEQARSIREIALAAYRAIDCAGLARVDFFVEKKTGQVLINEINTMPGFTSISMYPKMWEHTGLPMPDLVKKLVELALERREESSLSLRTYQRRA